MKGTDFAAAGQALARAYALIRPNGAAWLAAWQAGDVPAADELSEWELEGHPFHPSTWSTTDMMTVTEVLDGMLAIYATPGTWLRAGITQDATGCPVEPESPGRSRGRWRVLWSASWATLKADRSCPTCATHAEWTLLPSAALRVTS